GWGMQVVRAIQWMLICVAMCGGAVHAAPERDAVLETMKRATAFMVEEVSYRGGYVWNYQPDRSRRWGEMEAFETMIWLQPPGTSSMGHVFLDAYHATGDEYYYQAAEQVAAALIWGQHPSGGWNYLVDFAGDRSLKQWYGTIGKNAWRLEEFQHYYGNATFDDQTTTDAAKFLLRLYVEKLDPRYKPALDHAIQFVLDSQYPIGGWPQRYPLSHEFSKAGHPDYTSYLTFNDDVAAENIAFLILCYRVLGEQRLLDPITRGMNFFLMTQQGAEQPGWALQYTLDLKPAAARTCEPLALATHTTASNIGHLISFYELTGESKFLARVPEAIDWLEARRLANGPTDRGSTHPTFIEIGTDRALYVHRKGSNVVNGEYYTNYESDKPLGHYSAFRRIDIAGLRERYEEARSMSPEAIAESSPLMPGQGVAELPRFFAEVYAPVETDDLDALADDVVQGLNETGYWPAPLPQTSHPYRGDGASRPARGDFSGTHVGDESDTSPFTADTPVEGISTAEYLRSMNVLIRWLAGAN
ncbi:MAG: pectate lyase, partial [Woeseiaceae bacterium]